MTTYDPEDQAERRSVLRNDARLRDQSRNGDTSSYINHYSPEMGGRFSNVGAATVVGTTPNPYPAASAPFQRDPVPDEPGLGYRIHDLNPHDPEPFPPSAVQATDDPADAPSGGSGPAPYGGLVSEPAGSSPSSEEQTNE
jgi:hypothetical protein